MRLILIASMLIFTGCAAPRTAPVHGADAPTAWQATSGPGVAPQQSAPDTALNDTATGWLATFQSTDLRAAVDQAMASNYRLAQQALAVDIAEERVRILRADRLPQLSLTLGGQRLRADQSDTIFEQVDVRANLSLAVDLWGKLSDAQRQAFLNLQAEKMDYLDARRRLAAEVVNTFFDATTSRQLQELFSRRLANLAEGLDVIEQGYRSGLNEALDVYLARNTVEQERANVANQQQASFEAITRLELLLAEYPAAAYAPATDLPELSPMPDLGVPSALLTRRPDISVAWFDLLAADAALAVAHKDRFPSLTLAASAGDSDSALNRLLDGGSVGFTAAASLFQPLFLGGRLQSLERQAQMRVEQAEQRYLQAVFAAFAEVENELNRAASLAERYSAFVEARSNAEAALTLAYNQYQRGLVTFTTVLESQRRAFDAQTTVINLRNQLLQSRVALLLALGGAV